MLLAGSEHHLLASRSSGRPFLKAARFLLAPILMVMCAQSLFAQTTCPETVMTPACGTVHTTASRDSASCDFGEGGGYTFVDHRLGALEAYCGGGDGGAGFWLDAVDRYRVTGLPAGTPVTVVAHFRVNVQLNLSCGYYPTGSGAASLRHGTSESSISVGFPSCNPPYGNCCGRSASRAEDLAVTIAINAEDEFVLTASISAYMNWGTAWTNGTLSFSDIPQGASVVSCKAFQQDAPTEVRSASWGQIKTRYR